MKKTTLFLLALAAIFQLFLACKKNEEVVTPNSPPLSFVITSKQTNADLLLTWTKAKDPEGDLVNYTVVYKDTLARKISDTSYVLKNVPYASTITGSVIAKDSQGASTIVPFSIKTIEDSNGLYTSIPDINFEKALIALKIDDFQDGKILKSNAERTIQLNLYLKSIQNLKGIEAFKNLTYLDCSTNQLTSIDVSSNVNLTYLACNTNALSSIDVSKNINLENLICSNNQLMSIDVSTNKSLTQLHCAQNQLKSLDVSKNINLKYLYCYKNQLKSIDVSKNTSLGSFNCNSNQLTSLDVSKNTRLDSFDCSSNQFTSLDVSKNALLTYLNCANNQIVSIDISKNTVLDTFWCSFNKLSSLDLSNNTNLETLYCYVNQLTTFDVRKNTKLLYLSCDSNNIQTICVNSLSQPKSNWKKDDTATYKVCP